MERKWNENWNEHPAEQCIDFAAQVQANIKCSQSAYLQIWNRYLHWKVGIFLCIQGPPIWMLAANFIPVQFMETSETILRHYCVSHCHMSAILLLLLKYFSRYTKIFSWSSVQTIQLYWDTSRVKFTIYCGNSSDTSRIYKSETITYCLLSYEKSLLSINWKRILSKSWMH